MVMQFPATDLDFPLGGASLGDLILQAHLTAPARARAINGPRHVPAEVRERQAEVAALKRAARAYDRASDLAAALDVDPARAAVMPDHEAIRRLSFAIAEASAPVHGRLVKQKTVDARLLSLRAALLCERLARRRDRATAASLCFALTRERLASPFRGGVA